MNMGALPTQGATPWSSPATASGTPGTPTGGPTTPVSPILAASGQGTVQPSPGLSVEDQILRAARGGSGGMTIGGV